MITCEKTSALSEEAVEIGRFSDKLANEFDSYQGPDRRVEARRRMVVPVLAMPFDDHRKKSGAAFQAVTRDFSGDGIGLFTVRPVTTPLLGLLFQTQSREEMMVVIEVTRCRRVGIYYDVGGRISGMLQTKE